MAKKFCFAGVMALAVMVGSCSKVFPTGPSDPGGSGNPGGPGVPSPPTATLQLLDLRIGIVNGTEFGAPLVGPVSVGTELHYTIIFGAPAPIPYGELTVTFRTLCGGEVMDSVSLRGGAGAGSNNGAQYNFRPMVPCSYMVQASLTGATPPMKEASFEAR